MIMGGIVIVAVAAVLIYVIAVESPAAHEVVKAAGAPPVLTVINSTAVAYESPPYGPPQLVLCSWVNSTGGVEGGLLLVPIGWAGWGGMGGSGR